MAGLALASVVACAVESPVAPATPGVTGLYELSSVNGRAMPQLLGQDYWGTVVVLSGTLTLNADATYLDIVTVRRHLARGVTLEVDTIRGGYLHFEQTLLLQPADGGGGSFYSILDAKTLVVSNPGFFLVYRRD